MARTEPCWLAALAACGRHLRVASSDRQHEHLYTVANEVVRAPGWLQARWTDSTLTVVAIAMLAGCSDRHVRKVARDLGLPPRRRGGWRTRKPKPEPKPPSRYTQLNNPTWLREQYIFERRPLLAIAREVGCDRSAVRSALRRHGVTSRALRSDE